MLKKIISGGQTGVDRAALDVGLESGLPVGGYCPAGRKADDGCIDDKYPLIEITGGYRQRNKANVESSDGTVLFYDSIVTGGTELTLMFCIKAHKPYILIDMSNVTPSMASNAIEQFINQYQINTLNVAGPSHNRCPQIYDFVKAALSKLIWG